MQPKTARIVLRTVGVLAIASAVFGLWYNALTFSAIYTDQSFESALPAPTPFFRQAFYVMSAICIASYLILAWCGVQFLRLSTAWWWVFGLVGIVELLLLPVLGRLWLDREWGMSIGAASGIAVGGLMPQLIVLFPLWGPIAVWLARKSLRVA